MKMQFQVGEIIACEEVKKSKKLLCSQVKIGSQVKQIVSGIKAHYKLVYCIRKGYAWRTAIGLQAVDGLKTSQDPGASKLIAKLAQAGILELVSGYGKGAGAVSAAPAPFMAIENYSILPISYTLLTRSFSGSPLKILTLLEPPFISK